MAGEELMLFEFPRLTVDRRLRVRLRGPASWRSAKFRPIYNIGCFFVQVDEFVHDDMLSFVFSGEVQ